MYINDFKGLAPAISLLTQCEQFKLQLKRIQIFFQIFFSFGHHNLLLKDEAIAMLHKHALNNATLRILDKELVISKYNESRLM